MIAILILIISMIMIGELIKLKKEVRRLKKQTTIIMKEIKILKKT